MMMRSGPSWAGISSDSTSTPSARGDRVGPRGMPQRSAEDTGRAERVHCGAYVIDAACPLANPTDIDQQLPELRRRGGTCSVGTVASMEGRREPLHAIAALFPTLRQRPRDLGLAT